MDSFEVGNVILIEARITGRCIGLRLEAFVRKTLGKLATYIPLFACFSILVKGATLPC